VGLQHDSGNDVTRTRIGTRIERVEGTIGIQAADSIACRRPAAAASKRGELTDDENLFVGLQRQRLYGIVRARVETGIEGSIGVEASQALTNLSVDSAERTAHDDFAVGLNGNREYASGDIWIEAAIDGSIGVETSDIVAGCRATAPVAELREASADNDLAVRLHGDCADGAVGARTEGWIDRPVRVESRDVLTDLPSHGRKEPADQ